jgi:UDP-N-acetylglucosamine 2-epimerase (non-hydrolysing)
VVSIQEPLRAGVVLGTHPEAIKLAPVILALDSYPQVRRVAISTGQHREMLKGVLDLFGLAPDIELGLFKRGRSLAEMSAEMLKSLTNAFDGLELDLVVVQGDTTSAMAGALASFYPRLPVVHVEAGLRSGDLDEPFLEEMNRRMISVVSALHWHPPSEP